MLAYFIACIASMIGRQGEKKKFFSLLKFTGYLVPLLGLFFHSSIINILGKASSFLRTRFDKI